MSRPPQGGAGRFRRLDLDDGLADRLDERLAADALEERLGALERLGATTGEDMHRQVIEDFLQLSEDDLARMQRALAGRDGPGLTAAAHSLAGNSGILGATGLAADCVGLQAAARRLAEPEGPPACTSRLAAVERSYRALAARLGDRLTA